jgi:hypothetical protein
MIIPKGSSIVLGVGLVFGGGRSKIIHSVYACEHVDKYGRSLLVQYD